MHVPPRLFARVKGRKRAAVSVAAVAVVLLAGGLWAAQASGGTPNGETYVDGNPSAVLYDTGHRALVPEFSGTTLAGAPFHFASYRGSVVVLNFWGSWCAPCRSEGQTLAALSGRYGHAGVSFIGVDENDTPANAEAFEQGFGITYPSLNDPSASIAQTVSTAVLISSPPTTLVIDRTGHVAGAIFGTATYSVLDTMIGNAMTSKAGA
jgi:thiol-disulfide isomerase/thioredoxin